MMRALCDICKVVIFIDQETHNRFNSQATDDPHRCQSNALSLYQIVNGIHIRYSEPYIAKLITDEAIRLGLDPYKVRTFRKGDKLFVMK